METANVLTWFSGFDVPRDDIRKLWVDFEALPMEKTLDSWAYVSSKVPEQCTAARVCHTPVAASGVSDP